MARQITDDWRNATIDYKTLISEGRFGSDYKLVHKYAVSNTVVGGAAPAILANNTAIDHFPAAELQMRLVSTSVADDLVGAGMQLLKLVYLDDAAVEHTEIVEMDGTTPVNTTATDIYRIIGISGIKYGSTDIFGLKGSTGTITLENVAGTVVYSQIAANRTYSESAVHWIVPGNRVVISEVKGASSEESSVGVEIGIFGSFDMSGDGGGTSVFIQACGINSSWGNPLVVAIDPHFSIMNDSDYIQALAFVVKAGGTGNKNASGSFVLYEFTPDY